MLIGKNVTIDGFRTSIRLESEMWDALDEICRLEGGSYNKICALVESRGAGANRTSAIRSYIVSYFRQAAECARNAEARAGEALSFTDPLTGVANRLAMLPRLEQERQRMKRTASQCAIAVASLDNLEDINAKFGREAGDKTLQAVAEYLLNSVRLYDQVFRLRGNEFLIVLPNATSTKAKRVLDRMRCALARQEIPMMGKTTAVVTASFGIAPLSDEASLETVIIQASEAMRCAKETGRNRTRVWECRTVDQEKLLRFLDLVER